MTARTTQEQCVYIFGAGHNFYKIGIAIDPEKRRRDLQCGSPLKLMFVGASLVAEDGVNPREMERLAHFELADYRVTGEWFKAPSDVVHKAFKVAYCRLRYPRIVERWERLRAHYRTKYGSQVA